MTDEERLDELDMTLNLLNGLMVEVMKAAQFALEQDNMFALNTIHDIDLHVQTVENSVWDKYEALGTKLFAGGESDSKASPNYS